MEAAEFKEAIHGAMREHGVTMMADYFEMVKTEGCIDDRRKALQMVLTTLGVEEEKRKDDRANLPTFVINFSHGGVSAAEIPTIEMASLDELPALEFCPTEAMRAYLSVNADLQGLREAPGC